MNIPNACLPREDERDYKLGLDINIDSLPKEIINDDFIIQDQNDAGYPMGCVHFSSSMNDNYSNLRDGITTKSKGGDLCNASDTFSAKSGDYINAGPRVLKDLSHIKGYFNVTSLTEIMYWLSKGYVINCGSNTINWDKTIANDGIAIIDEGSGHAFQIIGYDKNYIKCKNSYNSFKYFKIKKEDFNTALYPNKYIFENDFTLINNYKKEIMETINIETAKKAFLAGLWNGERATENITREEAVTVVFRAIEKLNNGGFDFSKIDKELTELQK